jgi:hypothetical protein
MQLMEMIHRNNPKIQRKTYLLRKTRVKKESDQIETKIDPELREDSSLEVKN